MTIDVNQEGLIIGVIGAGTMGRGIAQVAAVGGCTVKLFDADHDAALDAASFIEKMLGRAVERGRMEDPDAKAAVKRVEVVKNISEDALFTTTLVSFTRVNC